MIEQYPTSSGACGSTVPSWAGRPATWPPRRASASSWTSAPACPAPGNTHEVTQRAAPGSRVVYADNDPIVLAHAKALVASAPEGACAYIDADIRDTGKILQDAAGTLDFSRPWPSA